MRRILAAALTVGAFTLMAGSEAVAAPSAATAMSAERYGIQATYRGPAFNTGYSARTRRMTACLASYPGAYDPKSDLIRVRPGVTRRCSL